MLAVDLCRSLSGAFDVTRSVITSATALENRTYVEPAAERMPCGSVSFASAGGELARAPVRQLWSQAPRLVSTVPCKAETDPRSRADAAEHRWTTATAPSTSSNCCWPCVKTKKGRRTIATTTSTGTSPEGRTDCQRTSPATAFSPAGGGGCPPSADGSRVDEDGWSGEGQPMTPGDSPGGKNGDRGQGELRRCGADEPDDGCGGGPTQPFLSGC